MSQFPLIECTFLQYGSVPIWRLTGLSCPQANFDMDNFVQGHGESLAAMWPHPGQSVISQSQSRIGVVKFFFFLLALISGHSGTFVLVKEKRKRYSSCFSRDKSRQGKPCDSKGKFCTKCCQNWENNIGLRMYLTLAVETRYLYYLIKASLSSCERN